MAVQKLLLTSEDTLGFEEVTWDKIRQRVKAINPRLAGIIDEFNPGEKYTFIQARYPYGVNILGNRKGYFPNGSGELTTLDDPRASKILQSKLSYNSSPLGLVLNKSVEIYVETPGENRSIPLKVLDPGMVFGVWEVMRFPPVTLRQNWNWNISSGVRTLFMLASISEAAAHEKLRHQHKVRSYIPDTIFDHHKIFKEITHHAHTDWCTEILFFTDKWLEPHENNIGWIKLKEYWAQQAWWQIQYWANRVILNLNWKEFTAELNSRKIKLNTYLLDTVKQLISIATGTITGFHAIDDSETVAPSKMIEDVYLNHYALKNYAPLLMQPGMLLPDNPVSTVYYSLQYPTLPERASELKSFPSTMQMLRQLKILMDIFLEVMAGYEKVSEPDSLDFNDCIQFDYFHKETDQYGVIQSTTQLVEADPAFHLSPQRFSGRPIPEGSHFFRGCVRVSFK